MKYLNFFPAKIFWLFLVADYFMDSTFSLK